MAPELLADLEAAELFDIASTIENYRRARNLSDAKLCARFQDLGHTKTWTKIRSRDLSELSAERQLANYRLALANIEALGDRESKEEPLYEGVWATVKLATAFGRTETETSVARCIFLLGPSGSGKTSAIRHLVSRRGSRILPIAATVVWNDCPAHMLGVILGRLGIRDVPMSAMDRLQLVQDKFAATRRGLAIEDAHHLGPRLLNLIITLIDSTPGEFIVSGIDKLWSKIETKSLAECRQLTGNRLAERIQIGATVRPSDAAKLLADRVPWPDEKAGKELIQRAAEHIAGKASGSGLLGFVREAVKKLNARLAERGAAVASWEDLVAAVDEEARSR